jgi:hypothetical protein
VANDQDVSLYLVTGGNAVSPTGVALSLGLCGVPSSGVLAVTEVWEPYTDQNSNPYFHSLFNTFTIEMIAYLGTAPSCQCQTQLSISLDSGSETFSFPPLIWTINQVLFSASTPTELATYPPSYNVQLISNAGGTYPSLNSSGQLSSTSVLPPSVPLLIDGQLPVSEIPIDNVTIVSTGGVLSAVGVSGSGSGVSSIITLTDAGSGAQSLIASSTGILNQIGVGSGLSISLANGIITLNNTGGGSGSGSAGSGSGSTVIVDAVSPAAGEEFSLIFSSDEIELSDAVSVASGAEFSLIY